MSKSISLLLVSAFAFPGLAENAENPLLDRTLELPALSVMRADSFGAWAGLLGAPINLEVLQTRAIARQNPWPVLQIPAFKGLARTLPDFISKAAPAISVHWGRSYCNITIRHDPSIKPFLEQLVPREVSGVWTWDGLLRKLQEIEPEFTCNACSYNVDMQAGLVQTLRAGQTFREVLNERAEKSGARWTAYIFDSPGHPFPMIGEESGSSFSSFRALLVLGPAPIKSPRVARHR